MKYYLLTLFLIIQQPLFAQTLQWAKAIHHTQPIGTLINEVTTSITTDAAGNVYLSGVFENSMDFDPGPAQFFLTSTGYTDVFIAKYSPNGNLIFAKSFGGIDPDFGSDIAIDPSGNIIITGTFQGTVDFDPGPGTQVFTSSNRSDVFFAKYDNLGNYIFVKTMGGALDDYGVSIASDASGNIYLSGVFDETMDFDPGPGVQALTTVRYQDCFFAKYDALGNYVYAKNIGGIWSDIGISNLAVDASGNLYLTGAYVTTVDFDPGPGVQNLTSPTIGLVTYADVFFAKYDALGNYVYVKKITGGTGLLYSYLDLDLSGNIYLSGGFTETADFDPGPGTLNLTSNGDYDIFIAKYDNSGNIIYAKNMGGGGYDHALAIAVDATGSIYISGEFWDIADFDPNVVITQNLTAILGDAFFAKYDASGNYVYAKQIGSTGSDYSEHLTLDPSGNVIVAGAFEETVNFDCITSLTALGAMDLFLAKYGPLITSIIQQPVNVSLCDKGNTIFSIKATDHSSSLWQVNTGSGWINLTNNATYAGTSTDSLIISNVSTTMNNYQFRCLIVNRCDTLFSSASALVVFPLPSAFLPADTSICTNGGSLTINALPGFTNYLWYNGSINTSITINNPGTYWLEVTDQKNCKNKDSITVALYGPSTTSITKQPVNVSLCDKGNTSFSIKATGHSSSLWQVNTGSGWINLTNNANYAGSATDSLIISNVKTTMNNYQYRCMVVNRCDTLFSSASALVVFSLPNAFLPADTSICDYGGSLTINALPGFTKYLWNNSSINSSITITNPGIYWLEVTDQKNCKNKDSITVASKQCLKGFYVPTAFTPNRDGKNDLFRPLLFGNVKKYQFIIYNRWGEVVFETTDMSKGWNGDLKGRTQSTNLFVWLCYYELEGEEKKFEKGSVVLIR